MTGPSSRVTWPAGAPPERASELPPSSRAGLDVISQNEGDLPRRREARDAGAEIVASLFRLVKLATMHAADNLAVVQRVEEIVAAVRTYAARAARNVSILFLDETVLVGGLLLQANRASYEAARELAALFARVGVTDVAISRDARAADFFALATTLGEALRAPRGTRIAERPSPRVRLRAATPLQRRRDGPTDRLDPVAHAASAYASACVVMRRLYEALGRGHLALPHRVKRIAQRLVDLSAGEMPAFLGVTDARRGGHDEAQRAVNASILTLAMARQITADPVLLSRIAMAALLSDVGRFHVAGAFPGSGRIVPQLGAEQEQGVPAATALLLTAMGRVNEPSVMRTVMAFEACAISRREPRGLPYDGAHNPTLQAYLIAVARAYVDGVSTTLGSPSRTADEAFARLTERWPDGLGRTALRLLIGALGMFPSGTLVELTTGEVAAVVTTPADPSSYSMPLVRVVLDMAGYPVDPPFEVDLASPEPGTPMRHIRRVVAGAAGGTIEVAPRSVRSPVPASSRSPVPPSSRTTASSRSPIPPTSRTPVPPSSRTPVPPSSRSSVPPSSRSSVPPSSRAPVPPSSRTRSRPTAPPITPGSVRVGDPGGGVGRGPITGPPTRADRPAWTGDLDGGREMAEASSALPATMPPEETLDSADRSAITPEPSPTVRPPAAAVEVPSGDDQDEPADRVPTRTYSAEERELVELTMPPPDELAAAIVEPVRPAPTAEGSFTRTPLVHLLVYILDQRLTGTATFFPPDGLSHDVYFEQGVASKIRTGAMIWPLDRVLVNLRLVDEPRLVEALVEISRTRMLLGRHLVARGLVSRDDVLSALCTQLVHKLVSLCDLPAETKYAFYKDANLIKHYGGPELLGSEPLATIMAAVRASPPNAVSEATLARIAHVPLGFVPNTDLGPFELSREEAAVCDLLRVRRMRCAELVSAGAAPELVVKRVIYALVITRYIDLGGAQKPPLAFTPPATRTDRPAARASETRHDSIPGVVNADAVPVQQPPTTPPPPAPRAPQSPAASKPATAPPAAAAPKPTFAPGGAGAVKPTRSAPPAAAAARQPAAARGPAEITARRAEIQIRAAAIEDETYFEILGIGRGASADEARNAYFALAKRWHPDRTPPELVEMKPLIATVFAKIGEAYATLGDGEKRAAYLKSLDGPGAAHAAAEEKQVERAVNAVLEFQKAEALLKKNDLAGAERHVRLASDTDPGQPEYLTLLAWVCALRRGEPKDLAPGIVSHHYDDLIQMLDEVLRGDPRYERALFYRGTLLKRSGKVDKAIRDFRLAAELNERNLDAVREVRLYEMRRREARGEGGSGQSGLFGKWFKR